MHNILPSTTSSLSRLNRLLGNKTYNDARFFILLDENTYNHCLTRLVSQVERLQGAEFMEVPVGEECKDIAIATQLWQTLLESDADRNAVLVNLGGGGVSDLGGFVAAGYKRGIHYINIPTTLIGMIDAAIGGKTAINLEDNKNQIGFFYPPDITCIEPAFLDSLPDKELFNGIFEMLKTLIIADIEQYNRLCDMILSGTFEISPKMISLCVEIKSAVVKKDPRDESIRHILNFGHTFGHAIESYSLKNGKEPLSHGSAVGIGMVCALYLSSEKLGLPQQELDRYRNVVQQLLGLPHYSLKETEEIISFMRHDKKNAGGEIRCVLLQAIGAPVIDCPVNENEIRKALLNIS